MEDNINNIISNALLVKKGLLNCEVITSIIEQIRKAFEINRDIIKQANEIDRSNNNGFILDFKIIENIFLNLEKEKIIYGDVISSQKDDSLKIIYGKQIMSIGNVVVINDGNSYVIIEMILRNIMAGNTTILSNDGFMYGTNKLIIEIIQAVLEQFSISKYLIQIYITDSFDELLSNFANIDLVVCIGNRDLQNLILNKSKVKTIVSGYDNYDLYIEDATYIDFLDKIINTGLNIEVYINKTVNLNYDNAILVNDIDEAIAQINYTGSKYSSAIFTTSSENASKFIREVKSHMVTINTSPTIERLIDIKQTDLIIEKTIIYPNNFNLDGSRIEFGIIKKDDYE